LRASFRVPPPQVGLTPRQISLLCPPPNPPTISINMLGHLRPSLHIGTLQLSLRPTTWTSSTVPQATPTELWWRNAERGPRMKGKPTNFEIYLLHQHNQDQ
jgi:hypothetical protein